jgi:hypothetical protein
LPRSARQDAVDGQLVRYAQQRRRLMFGTKTKTKPVRWTPDEQQRIDAYRAACATLTDAICEHAPDYLLWRARQMAASANRGALPAAAVATKRRPDGRLRSAA